MCRSAACGETGRLQLCQETAVHLTVHTHNGVFACTRPFTNSPANSPSPRAWAGEWCATQSARTTDCPRAVDGSACSFPPPTARRSPAR
eukprot:1160878-Pelagomonas_calceolata.AAC.2